MQSVLGAAGEGLLLVFSWPNLAYPVVGTFLAMLVALIPGISSITLMALAIPLTLSWEPLPVLLLFGAFVGGGTFMGSVTAILVNVPGTAPNAATMIDGYPMAQRGEAKTALACSATASALGSTFGVVLLIAAVPIMPTIIMSLGPPEFLLLALWGLTTVAAVSRGSMYKGLGLAGIGLLLAFVGLDPRTAEARFTFGTLYLRDGLSLVPVFLGVFAIAEMIDLGVSGKRTISGRSVAAELGGSVREGIRCVLRHFGLLLRSSTIGSVIGMIPGVGGTVASFVAYGHAVQTGGGDGATFGRGDIRGVLAPEAANDAKDGAALIPTLAFGVPGSAATALLLATFVLHGLVPGKELISNHLSLVFALIWSLTLSSWLTSTAGLLVAGYLTRLTVVRTQVLVPVILMIALLGAYVSKGRISDVLIAATFGIFGYFMKRFDWPRISLVIALVLGPLVEMNLHLTLRLQELGRINILTRPISLTLILLSVASLLMPLWRRARSRPA